jgi:hypothetical protein
MYGSRPEKIAKDIAELQGPRPMKTVITALTPPLHNRDPPSRTAGTTRWSWSVTPPITSPVFCRLQPDLGANLNLVDAGQLYPPEPLFVDKLKSKFLASCGGYLMSLCQAGAGDRLTPPCRASTA